MTKSDGMQSLWNRTRGHRLAARVFRARSLWDLTVGLLGRPPLHKGDALWLEPCGSIHTWGMRYAIDVLFLDRERRVLRVTRDVQPWRIAPAPAGTRSVVELLPAQELRLQPGDQLDLA